MEVILLEKMRNLGTLGDKVKVKPGFARNYLIPQGKAVYANKTNLERFEARRSELEKLAAERHERALKRQAELNAIGTVTIVAKAGDEGKLFGSIGTRDITNELNKLGANVEKRDVRLPAGTLRMVGDYEITIELDSDMQATVKVSIVGEG